MADNESLGERSAASASQQDEVARRLAELTSRKRGRVRWRMSKHTAEMALNALRDGSPARRGGRGKQRRHKRHKRLL
jgi:hypothetical protein